MEETDAKLFARLRADDPEFARLAEKHRQLDRQIGEYDRIYYLTSEQERKRKDLQKQKLALKDRLYALMGQARKKTA
jgi:uncharacterized protein YdcH (DUF465 family)